MLIPLFALSEDRSSTPVDSHDPPMAFPFKCPPDCLFSYLLSIRQSRQRVISLPVTHIGTLSRSSARQLLAHSSTPLCRRQLYTSRWAMSHLATEPTPPWCKVTSEILLWDAGKDNRPSLPFENEDDFCRLWRRRRHPAGGAGSSRVVLFSTATTGSPDGLLSLTHPLCQGSLT